MSGAGGVSAFFLLASKVVSGLFFCFYRLFYDARNRAFSVCTHAYFCGDVHDLSEGACAVYGALGIGGHDTCSDFDISSASFPP